MSDYLRIKVRGFHLDRRGHLNNVSYIQFLEEARWAIFDMNNAIEFFAKLDHTLTLVNSNINYRRPAFLNEMLEIRTRLLRVGTASCVIQQSIYLEDTATVILESEHTFVLMDKDTNCAVPIEGEARNKLEQIANLI